ncbi:hypothetical protein TWF569_004686 [Orbilia oligospora]|uniref:Uncharacterized protein n=1 Tax=Orbilia oligospora TaxID=2813651 RepID=A0A7C8JQ27_ORBOL|nr:hypothetical protein TWF103_008712 [Orbilia oligospora]KAF3105389.1 hypothetical protein TWF102_002310 [Orbilia oligospora]KAF3115054.1 hypothetical protein TWF706_007179 [Orbilia oligospora]KAF3133419.1 hypothetical protein TWF703_006958 [Orbilia oligospora]KAF3150178.1 hypothetical protein TWF594_010061 [Orbilia oligospora]
MTRSSSSDTSEKYAGSPDYPVFPNPIFLSKFALVSSDKSGRTNLDTDLYNSCILPYNPLSYPNNHKLKSRETITITNDDNNKEVPVPKDTNPKSPRPTYQLDRPPCKRAAAINANCYFQNTNGTFSGLQPYDSDFEVQQKCFCEIYPYFDSIFGCNECFRLHGGIEGYHYFPQSYMEAVSSTYCNANPITTAFYPFVSSWSKTNELAKVPTTTAPNVLGTQTEQSLYWTYAAAMTGSSNPSSGWKPKQLTWISVLATIALAVVTSGSI